MKKLLLLALLFFFFSVIEAQSIVWEGESDFLNIGPSVSILEDVDGAFSIEQVSSNSFEGNFVQSEQVVLNFGYSTNFYWLKFSLENKTGEPLWLEMAQAYLPTADFYFQDKYGGWQKYEAGYLVNTNEKKIKHHFQIFPIPNSNTSQDFFIRFRDYAHPVPINIWTQNAYEIKANKQKMYYGLFVGILIFVILNNLFLYFSLQRFTYLHYAFLVFVHILISSCVMDGYILYLFPDTDLMFWYFLIPSANQVNTVLFAILFLEVKKYAPRFFKISLFFVGYLCVTVIGAFYIGFVNHIISNVLHGILVLFYVWVLGYMTWKNGNKMGYYFGIAYFIYLAIVITEAIYIQTGKPAYLFELSHVSIALFFEVMILAFLLSKRFEWEKIDIEKAKAEAQQKVIEKTKENEKMIREQNMVLEQEVIKQTTELNNSLKATELERQKSDELLLNILPATTAKELKEKGKAEPQTHHSVSVLFADFKNFLNSISVMSPQQLVDDLDYCYRAFDQIMQKYEIEKIKTVGDTYMAAGGLMGEANDHAVNTVHAGLEMLAFMKKWQKENLRKDDWVWEIRLGIHTGQVISGVVGSHKFSYDIWGDTVNIASRMESYGSSGKLNISATTYELVKKYFHCTPRGSLDVKGKGELEMYWVDGTK